MDWKSFIRQFLLVFAIGFLVNLLIALAWTCFKTGSVAEINWESSIRIALVLAIVIPLSQIKRK